MIRRNTWIVLAVFVALLALAIFWDRIPALNPPEETPTAAPFLPSLFEFQSDEVQKLTLNGITGENAVYELQAEGLWSLTAASESGNGDLDSEAVGLAVEQLVSWKPLTSLESITELGAIGLVNPATRITIKLASGEEVQVGIGDETVTGSGYYVHVENQQPQIISKAAVEQVTGLLYTPPMLEPTPTPTLSPELTPTAELTLVPEQATTPEITPTPE
jgi:hypothetical protein